MKIINITVYSTCIIIQCLEPNSCSEVIFIPIQPQSQDKKHHGLFLCHIKNRLHMIKRRSLTSLATSPRWPPIPKKMDQICSDKKNSILRRLPFSVNTQCLLYSHNHQNRLALGVLMLITPKLCILVGASRGRGQRGRGCRRWADVPETEGTLGHSQELVWREAKPLLGYGLLEEFRPNNC